MTTPKIERLHKIDSLVSQLQLLGKDYILDSLYEPHKDEPEEIEQLRMNLVVQLERVASTPSYVLSLIISTRNPPRDVYNRLMYRQLVNKLKE